MSKLRAGLDLSLGAHKTCVTLAFAFGRLASNTDYTRVSKYSRNAALPKLPGESGAKRK